MQRKNFILYFILILSMFHFSCRKDLEKASWDTNAFAPIASTSLSINNLLPDSILKTNPDSSLMIEFRKNLFNFSMDTIFKIPDTTLYNAYNLPVTVTLQPGQPVLNNNISETTYNLKGAQLRTIVIKSGYIKYYVRSYINEVTDFVYAMPCASKNGVPFSVNISVPAAVGDTPGIFSKTYDMSGYVLTLTGKNNNKINTLYTSLTAFVSTSGKEVEIQPNDSLIIENTFDHFVPYFAKGYFGYNTIDIGPEETEFSVFKNIVDGSLKLEDVSFNFSIENPIGLDAQFMINDITSINSRKNSSIALTNSIVGSPININRAADGADSIITTYANFPINTGNSNIKSFIENLPDKLGYSMQIITNPLGNISGSNDFIYSDHLLKAIMSMQVPLSLVANNLTLADTVDLIIKDKEAAEKLNSGTLTAIIDNGFPYDAQLQIYMLNETNETIDSLFINSSLISQAPLNTALKATTKTQTTLSIVMNDAKMDKFINAKKLVYNVKFNTAMQPQYIKIYSDYTIDLKLIGNVNYTIQIK